MLSICQSHIKEVSKAEYVAIMCNETTDVYDKTHKVVVLRYELQGKPVERFWGFLSPANQTPEALAELLLNELRTLICNNPDKLIAQTYDAAVLCGAEMGVPTRIKENYKNAHFIHCYAHQLDLIVEKATSLNSSVRVFFNSLSKILAFFSRAQRTAALEKFVGREAKPSCIQRNSKSRVVCAINEMKDAFIECCSTLETCKSKDAGFAAACIKRTLNDPEFEFWLDFFSKLMPHIDNLVSQIQSAYVDANKVAVSLNTLDSAIQKIRDEYEEIRDVASTSKSRKCLTDKSAAVKEVCDAILLQCRERLKFINHLEASKLLTADNFPSYAKDFPCYELTQAVDAYPMREREKLRAELKYVYTRQDLCNTENLLDIMKVMNDSHLQSTFSEAVKLLKILIITPMVTGESGRCSSTMKIIKSFMRNNIMDDRLSALAMLSIENQMITEIKEFNEKVMNTFVTSKRRRLDINSSNLLCINDLRTIYTHCKAEDKESVRNDPAKASATSAEEENRGWMLYGQIPKQDPEEEVSVKDESLDLDVKDKESVRNDPAKAAATSAEEENRGWMLYGQIPKQDPEEEVSVKDESLDLDVEVKEELDSF
ncbi:zinc finger MYM-type protein 1-like isoform X1 [Panulirus ornatus]|uniref:zinc finger MYM-type protein 1-like isoform X1 n=1 Tax=Panulirus ornatus TaxID=150431 RepID=UPI003A868E8D